ncbi:MAG: histidine kinase, partial [Bacteroidales bacterium]|nr:histidine kinase [Bacteroidales bacterium]
MIHPITGNRSRLIVWWLIWLLIGLGQSLILFSANCNLTTSLIDGIFSALFYGLISIAIWFPIRQLNSGKTNRWIFITNHLILSAISVMIWLFSVKWITISLLQDPSIYEDYWTTSFYYRLGAGLFIYAVVILTYYLLISIENINRKNIREANLEKLLKETELMMLRSQINPHFLFNSLNSISSLTITNPEKAREMVIKLSDFMRYALSQKEDRIVPLKTELENMNLYLEIEKVRFGEKLVLKESVEEATLKVRVPNMILQPLYENAIKH